MYSDDIAARDFVVAPEGYDREEVRAYLEVVAREQQALRDEVEALRHEMDNEGDVGADVAVVLETAQKAAEEAVRLAHDEAEELRTRAEAEADRVRQATIEASDNAREEADRYAFQTRADADRDARERLMETNEKIERLLDGATKVRDRLFGLDAILDSLRTEVSQAAGALGDGEVEAVELAELSTPLIDLDAAEGNGSRVATEA